MNWGDLKTMAGVYVHRKDINWDAAQIPACDRLSQALDVQDNEAVATGSLTTTPDSRNLYSMPLPIDFARMKSVLINGDVYTATGLLNLLEDGIGDFEYAVSGSSLWASVSGSVSYAYGQQIDPIVGDTATSVILTRFPRAYLYAVVMEGYIQIQDFDAASGYQPALDEAIAAANGLQAFARYDAGSRPKTAFARI